ncbi:somatomedin-B and thrombospondin type-1 domain-containing protein-like [Pecten maximus]|uniref:somatomedin-B and thrombospondin type-1 domain-containing protein-like n=1 Tax=Pecten maximus TaxID=6579 RepID=UPI0014586B50|nr:somatomedin-B and thrombospondin type-1 domain-containing protein-like [Pecten maximus]
MESLVNIVCLVLLVCALSLCEGAYGGCKEAGFCCDGKNITCHVVMGNPRFPRRCYCDSYCQETNDCCPDYNSHCKDGKDKVPVNCEVGLWGKWNECESSCGLGRTERSRQILVTPKNGGKICPKLRQKRRCMGKRCWEVQDVTYQGQELQEIGKILPAEFGIFRTDKQYDPYQGIRKNLFSRISNEVPPRPAYCSHYKIVESNRHCNTTDFGKTWANKLQPGNKVCVECQPFAMDKEAGLRCKGHGVYRRPTHWKALDVHHCHGKWIMEEIHGPCTCNVFGDSDFILV